MGQESRNRGPWTLAMTKRSKTSDLAHQSDAEIADSFDEELEMEIDDERLAKALEGLAEKAEPEGLDRTLYFKELFRLQRELVKLQDWVVAQKLKIVVVFEGRNAAGKGGVIKRITQRLNPPGVPRRGPASTYRARLHCVVNTGQTGWRDLPIMRINTGLSIATIPSFIWPVGSFHKDGIEESSGRLCPRPLGRGTGTHAWWSAEGGPFEVLCRGMSTIDVRRVARILSRYS